MDLITEGVRPIFPGDAHITGNFRTDDFLTTTRVKLRAIICVYPSDAS